MSRWFFTYGIGSTLADCYSVVEADTREEAVDRFLAVRGTNRWWAFVYPEDQYDDAIARYNMTEVPVDTPAHPR